MTPDAWIALGALGFLVASTTATAIVSGFRRIGSEIKAVEAANQGRHTANESRLTAIETQLRFIANGGPARRRHS